MAADKNDQKKPIDKALLATLILGGLTAIFFHMPTMLLYPPKAPPSRQEIGREGYKMSSAALNDLQEIKDNLDTVEASLLSTEAGKQQEQLQVLIVQLNKVWTSLQQLSAFCRIPQEVHQKINAMDSADDMHSKPLSPFLPDEVEKYAKTNDEKVVIHALIELHETLSGVKALVKSPTDRVIIHRVKMCIISLYVKIDVLTVFFKNRK